MLDSYRNTSETNYDCIIPVSGAKDSFFIVDTIKNTYGMNPLLVTYNKHYNTKLGIDNLSYLRTLLDCDILTLTLKPELLKKITRATLKERASIYWHCLAGQSVFPVRIAVGYKVPLIIWGAHQGCDQVGMYSHHDYIEMTRKYRKEHDLMGLEAEDLVNKKYDLSERELQAFMYPHDKEIERVGVRGVYLSNYIRWDSKAQHEVMIKKYNYQTAQPERTIDAYNDIDCRHYNGLHDYIKYLKWGYSKITDHVCREIRLNRLTREEGIELVEKYHPSKKPRDLAAFLSWIDMTEAELFETLNLHRDNKIQDKASMLNDFSDSVRLEKLESCEFIINSSIESDTKYKMLTRGFVDEKIRPQELK
ncbi:MAG: N-acetyl sugar amidotransferase [Bdellovibrionota bacterium]